MGFFSVCLCNFISGCGIQFILQALWYQHWEELTKEIHEREKTMQRKKRTKEMLTIKNKKKDKVQSIHRRTGNNVVI